MGGQAGQAGQSQPMANPQQMLNSPLAGVGGVTPQQQSDAIMPRGNPLTAGPMNSVRPSFGSNDMMGQYTGGGLQSGSPLTLSSGQPGVTGMNMASQVNPGMGQMAGNSLAGQPGQTPINGAPMQQPAGGGKSPQPQAGGGMGGGK